MIQIQTTVATKEEGEKIADALVQAKLAACVQIIGPITSMYSWRNKVETAQEWLILIKTRTDLYDRVEKEILAFHSYETPEIIAIPIERSSAEYLGWLNEETIGD
ncbi:MAG: divalent-cation tolerance protein CutA [Actinomycetota bacterium]